MTKHLYIEDYIPSIRMQGGILSAKPVILSGTAATLAVGGTLAVTGTTVFTGGTTFTGAIVANGGVTGLTSPTVKSAAAGATVVLTAAQSGGTFQNASTSGSPSWTLPTAANGLEFTFTCANATAGFTVTGGTVHAKTASTGTAVTGTTLTHTQATAVVGDAISLVCDGTAWWTTAQMGIFTAA